jgi:hypothetical protein
MMITTTNFLLISVTIKIPTAISESCVIIITFKSIRNRSRFIIVLVKKIDDSWFTNGSQIFLTKITVNIFNIVEIAFIYTGACYYHFIILWNCRLIVNFKRLTNNVLNNIRRYATTVTKAAVIIVREVNSCAFVDIINIEKKSTLCWIDTFCTGRR